MVALQLGCRRCHRAPAASIVLASLLLLSAAARLPTAAAQRDSPSPSPEESPSPSPEESPSPSPEASPSPDAQGGTDPLNLDYPANRNADDKPVLTVTSATIEGRQVYYEVRQARSARLVGASGRANRAARMAQPRIHWRAAAALRCPLAWTVV